MWTSTHLTLKIICCCNTAKNLSEFTKKFPANMFLFCVRKKHLHSTVFWSPKLHSWSTFKANVRLFTFISVRKDIVRFYRVWGKLNNFIKAARFLGLVIVNVVQFFILIEFFVNSTIFLKHFHTSIYSIKTMKFSRHFELRG